MHWSRARVHGQIPPKELRAQTVNLVGESVYIFGGCDTKNCFNTLYIFDADTMHWSQPKTFGSIPPPCRAHSSTLVDNKRLYVFGGGDGPHYFNELYMLDTESPTWYMDAEKYWDTVPATINGMLGGLGQLARLDAVSSLRFLSEFVSPPATSSASSILNPPAESAPSSTVAGAASKSTSTKRQKLPLPGSGLSHVLDCGAGIGRVTKQVLIKAFDHVDLVENSAAFVKQAKEEYLKSEIEAGKVGEVRCSGLQNVQFEGCTFEKDSCA
ncbi:hypothetical protein EC968_008606 [Mortierella alpina]|nr:hypothetical protein EC968_008606 [Mortierella alpina]